MWHQLFCRQHLWSADPADPGGQCSGAAGSSAQHDSAAALQLLPGLPGLCWPGGKRVIKIVIFTNLMSGWTAGDDSSCPLWVTRILASGDLPLSGEKNYLIFDSKNTKTSWFLRQYCTTWFFTVLYLASYCLWCHLLHMLHPPFVCRQYWQVGSADFS